MEVGKPFGRKGQNNLTSAGRGMHDGVIGCRSEVLAGVDYDDILMWLFRIG